MNATAGREKLVEQARRLRDDGLFYRQIAKQLGVSVNMAWRMLNPERQRVIERRANTRKREWDRANRWVPCPRCGNGMTPGKKQCRDCYGRAKF